jgi:hypothetical protein
MNRAESIVATLWNSRKLLLALGVVISLGLGSNLRYLDVDNAIDIWFLKNDPALVEYKQFQKMFGHDEVVVVALKDESGMITTPGMARARALSDAHRFQTPKYQRKQPGIYAAAWSPMRTCVAVGSTMMVAFSSSSLAWRLSWMLMPNANAYLQHCVKPSMQMEGPITLRVWELFILRLIEPQHRIPR